MKTYSTSLIADSVTTINIGNSLSDFYIKIHYTCKRGSLMQMGSIDIVNDPNLLSYPNNTYENDDCGIVSIIGEKTGEMLSIKITLDDSSVSNATFNYSLQVYEGVIDEIQDEVINYIDGLSTPLSQLEVSNINSLVCDFKNILSVDSLSEAFDSAINLAAETEECSLRNLINTALAPSKIGNPTWKKWEGYTGVSGNNYIDTNFNPAINGSKYTLNDCSAGFFTRTTVKTGIVPGFAIYKATTGGAGFIVANTVYYSNQVNSIANNDTKSTSWMDTLGLFSIRRVSSLLSSYLCNDKKEDSSGVASSQLTSLNFHLLGRNNTGTHEYTPVGSQVSFWYAGKSITDDEHNKLSLAYDKYLSRREKNIFL